MSERLLLDTRVLIWTISDSRKISLRARRAMSNSKTTLCVSVISVWEIVLKHQAGKLLLATGLEEVLDQIQYHSTWTILPLNPAHLQSLSALPMLHKDPFDRMLIAQAKHERLTLVTADELIPKYDIQTIW